MLQQFNFHRPAAHHRTQPGVGPQFREGDLVSWRNPSTGGHWGGLRVEFVYPQLGMALVRGHIGRPSLKTGAPLVESARVRLADLTLEARAAERA